MGTVIAFVVGCGLGVLFVLFFVHQERKQLKDGQNKLHLDKASVEELRQELFLKEQELRRTVERTLGRAVAYEELQNENTILKRDLQNIDVTLHKLQLDKERQDERQGELDQHIRELGSRYLGDNVKWIGGSLTPNNFVKCKGRLAKVIERCRGITFEISKDEESQFFSDLKTEYEKVVRAALEREEQARIKAQIREEQKLEREIERELQQVERERAAIQAALDKAREEARDEHAEEVERLKERLAEAEARAERAKSRAQMTKSGHVYVISNIGSFGETVYKIGMTRRLEPNDRVKELGDASVPFPFDVHMMISSDDAPKLEHALHRAFHRHRVNRVNMRKEFFRVPLTDILGVVTKEFGQVDYVADAEALEYRQSQVVSDEDEEFIEELFAEESDEDDEPETDEVAT